MELSARAIEQVVHPTAAFASPAAEAVCDAEQQQHAIPTPPSSSWDGSLLNPKNRIDSLDVPCDPLWRIDGCSGLGTQYYAVPLFFLSSVPPLRVDVFVPGDQPRRVREQLDLDVAFHTKDAARLSRLGITRHIIRALQVWTRTSFPSLELFERFYRRVPFGTKLVFENMSLDIGQINIVVGYNHDLELRLLSLRHLQTIWSREFDFLQVVDLFDLHVDAVLHDSVCLVRIHGQPFIFKALVSGPKFLYHELYTLCSMETHGNIIGRPVHIVQKKINFGTKKAVVGFTTVYHPRGSLRDILPQLRIHGQLRRAEQFKWAVQLGTALQHLRTRSGTYYPDLRLDNVVLSDQSDIVMVDFEQRGVWCEFAAPEINAIEYVRLIATDENAASDVKSKYSAILDELVPDLGACLSDDYTPSANGFNPAWTALSPAEQEAAEVYMLGRVLWCIFEGVSGPQKAAVWQSYRWESNLEFPQYDQTPPEMRELIDRCTRGRRQTLTSRVVREHSQLVLRSRPEGGHDAADVRAAAKEFWLSELEAAERFLAERKSQRLQGTWNENYFDRPTLTEVLSTLGSYRYKFSE
ncbi:hypothetical protein GGR56DRAFT_182077 [Xylariaceae sp. FL0804]|nr:hypothetical protein GGR56DRAFT_182077 [Xylariaceae sp. FL0804]